MVDDIDLLMKLDRLVSSDDPTVMDALKSALVLAEVSEETKDKDNDGPFMRMYSKISDLQYQIDFLKGKIAGMGESNPYQNVTWTNTNSTADNYWNDPTRNYTAGYVWDAYSNRVVPIKTTTGTGS
jgi:hypothetical protein